MRVVVLGGLGYIGSALCELYKERPDCDVLVVDNNLVADRIAAFPQHMRFVHADITDIIATAGLCRGADVVHMLAAQVQAESSGEREELVWNDNYETPRKIAASLQRHTRFMFPSSGNVFGGLPEGSKYLGLTETDEPAPRLPYAESKRATELYLLKSSGNFTIVRFGTNYGYAPGVRFNLVTNIFVLKAMKNEEIKLFGGGNNYRPTACVQDCARALLFLSETPDARGELYNVSNESFTIRQLAANVAAAVNPAVRTVAIDRQVPFNSYAMDSSKIKQLGFTFDWPMQRALVHMKERLKPIVSATSTSLLEMASHQ
jgi:nucleoside-diphosphate-sugar epimerase